MYPCSLHPSARNLQITSVTFDQSSLNGNGVQYGINFPVCTQSAAGAAVDKLLCGTASSQDELYSLKMKHPAVWAHSWAQSEN